MLGGRGAALWCGQRGNAAGKGSKGSKGSCVRQCSASSLQTEQQQRAGLVPKASRWAWAVGTSPPACCERPVCGDSALRRHRSVVTAFCTPVFVGALWAVFFVWDLSWYCKERNNNHQNVRAGSFLSWSCSFSSLPSLSQPGRNSKLFIFCTACGKGSCFPERHYYD